MISREYLLKKRTKSYFYVFFINHIRLSIASSISECQGLQWRWFPLISIPHTSPGHLTPIRGQLGPSSSGGWCLLKGTGVVGFPKGRVAQIPKTRIKYSSFYLSNTLVTKFIIDSVFSVLFSDPTVPIPYLCDSFYWINCHY